MRASAPTYDSSRATASGACSAISSWTPTKILSSLGLLALPGPAAPPPVTGGPEAPVSFVDDPVPASSRPWIDAEDFHEHTLGVRPGRSWAEPSMGADLDELRRPAGPRDRMDREFATALDVPALARTALMSPAHFSRRFREAYSETPYSYLMTRRIERAKALLRRGDHTVHGGVLRGRLHEPRVVLGQGSRSSSGETPSAYRAADHDELQTVATCQVMVVTRPRKDRGGSEQFRRSVARPPGPSIADMSISLSTVHILVDDPEAALGFYRDALGWTVANTVENGGFTLDHPRQREPTRARDRPLAAARRPLEGGRRRPRRAAREG